MIYTSHKCLQLRHCALFSPDFQSVRLVRLPQTAKSAVTKPNFQFPDTYFLIEKGDGVNYVALQTPLRARQQTIFLPRV